MRKGRYSVFELLLYVDGEEKEIKFPRNKLKFDLGIDFMNLLFDIFEEVMFLNESKLEIIMKNGNRYLFHLTKINKMEIKINFFEFDYTGSKKVIDVKKIILGEFKNKGPKNLIDSVFGLRDVSNEMNILLNEYVDQENIDYFKYEPNY